MRSFEANDAGLQEIDVAAPVHLALDELEIANLSLSLPVGPYRFDGSGDGGLVFRHAVGERGEEATLGAVEPGVEFSIRLASDHVLECRDRVARLGNEHDAVLDRGDSECLRFRQIIAADRQQSRDRSSRRRATERGLGFVCPSSPTSPFAYDPQTPTKTLPLEVAPEFGAVPPTCRPLFVQPREPRLQRALTGAKNIRSLATQHGSNELVAESGSAADFLDRRAAAPTPYAARSPYKPGRTTLIETRKLF